MTKKLTQKFKYLENQQSFKDETKSIFDYFKELSVVKNCLTPKSVPLISLKGIWKKID